MPVALGREFAAAIAERVGIDDQQSRLGILDLEQLIVQRAQRMQPGDGEPRQLCGDAGAPGVGAVGGQERNPRPRRQAQCMNTCWMRPISSVAPW